jgi:hypothetical protein
LAPSSSRSHADCLGQRTRLLLRRALNFGIAGDRKSMARLFASSGAELAAVGSNSCVQVDFSSGAQSDFVIEAAIEKESC